jgi:hypothetical protein
LIICFMASNDGWKSKILIKREKQTVSDVTEGKT